MFNNSTITQEEPDTLPVSQNQISSNQPTPTASASPSSYTQSTPKRRMWLSGTPPRSPKKRRSSVHKLVDALQEFSIHKIDFAKLKSKQNSKLTSKSTEEAIIIEQIIQDINERHRENEGDFEKHDGNLNENALDTVEPPFSAVLYLQQTSSLDDFPRLFKYQKCNQGTNWIVFYYRPSEIFALTRGPTWTVIQAFCCYDFPIQISRRLTSSEGSFKHTVKRITGNKRVTTSTNSLPTLFDQLNTIEYSMTKEFRADASVYGLAEFDPDDKTKIRIGMGYIRILKKMCVPNLPEIFNHLALIASSGETRTHPGNQVEPDSPDIPKLRPASGLECEKADKLFISQLCSYMKRRNNDQLPELIEVNHKYVQEFADATRYELIVTERGKNSEKIDTFTKLPTASQLLSSMRTNSALANKENLEKFQKYLACIKLKFSSQGKPVVEKVMNCLEIELISSEGNNYWRTMGVWRIPRDEYYFDVHKSFVGLLNGRGVMMSANHDGFLNEVWNDDMSGVQDYLELYKNREKEGYFYSPLDKYFWDMINVQWNSKGEIEHIYAYFVFECFDARIRGTSVRIQKAMENIFVNKSAKQLDEFYEVYHENEHFSRIFPKPANFLECIRKRKNISIVLAIHTGLLKSRSTNQSTDLSKYFKAIPSSSRASSGRISDPPPTRNLEEEKNLEFILNEENVYSLVIRKLPDTVRIGLEEEFRDDPAESLELAVINRLVEGGYFKSTGSEWQVEGKLLKLRNSNRFQFSKDNTTNSAVFEQIKTHVITQFPGFIQKLECIQIQNRVRKIGVPLRIMEIARALAN